MNRGIGDGETHARLSRMQAKEIIAAEGMNYSQTFEVPPGSYQVRFIVRDNLSNKIGSVIAPLQVN